MTKNREEAPTKTWSSPFVCSRETNGTQSGGHCPFGRLNRHIAGTGTPAVPPVGTFSPQNWTG